MSEFVTPPGMPEGWTPPVDDVTVEPHEGISIRRALDICYAQCFVRDQNTEELDSVLDQLAVICDEFESKKIDAQTFGSKVGEWRNNSFQNCSADESTRAVWENAIIAMLRESTK